MCSAVWRGGRPSGLAVGAAPLPVGRALPPGLAAPPAGTVCSPQLSLPLGRGSHGPPVGCACAGGWGPPPACAWARRDQATGRPRVYGRLFAQRRRRRQGRHGRVVGCYWADKHQGVAGQAGWARRNLWRLLLSSAEKHSCPSTETHSRSVTGRCAVAALQCRLLPGCTFSAVSRRPASPVCFHPGQPRQGGGKVSGPLGRRQELRRSNLVVW